MTNHDFMSKRPNPMKQAKMVKDWNATYPVGTAVKVRMDDGTIKDSKTIAEASLLGGHTAVAWLEGFRGCFDLERVKPA